MAGVVVERFTGGDGRLLVLGYRWTDLRASRNGADVVLGVAPHALAGGRLDLQADAAFARAVNAGPATLLLQGGAATFVELARTVDFYPGLQAGVALLVPLEARLVGRIDLTQRVYLAAGETYCLWSVGFSLPAFSIR
jgi:hypothetical protein